MKPMTFSLAIATIGLLLSCQSQASPEANKKAPTKTVAPAANAPKASDSVCQVIGEAEYRELIMDYTTYTDKWIYKGTKPCMVDFYATWCGPCRKLAPVLEELAKEYAGRIVIYKVDVDKAKNLSAFFGVQSIPTLMFCPLEGNPTMQAGAPDKESLRKLFDQILLKADKTAPVK